MSKLTKLLAVVCILNAGLISTTVYGDTEFTYQGELKQSGSVANGSFDMEFTLWDVATWPLGTQIGPDVIINGVSVVDGKFTVNLDFGAESFDNENRWIEIAVEGNRLSPRQRVSRAPYAIQTRGIFVDVNHEIGLGTTNPSARLDVVSDTNDNGNNTARFSAPMLGPNTSHVHFGLDGDWFVRSANDDGKVVIQDTGGVVTIGTTGGGFTTGKLRVDADQSISAMDASSGDVSFPTIFAANAGPGPILWANGISDVEPDGGGVIVIGHESGPNIGLDRNEIMARNNGQASTLFLNVDGGDVNVGTSSGGTTKLITPVLQITGGADFSEMFDVGENIKPQPGMVVVIDPDNPGRLIPSTTEYDRKAAGIISGAGGVATGMTMGHDGTIADGKYPVALTGRVYCLVDGTGSGIEPGDMLTTSATPGHAMKANNVSDADGAIIGKAMTSLKKGERGLVLVLVNLQ